MSDGELLQAAKAHNLRFKAAVARVQEQLFDGRWDTDGSYGSVPLELDCGADRYRFSLHRTGPVGAAPRVDPASLARRLTAEGWGPVEVREFPGVSDDVVVIAEHPAAAVSKLYITYASRPHGVSISARSTCAAGDSWAVLRLMKGDAGVLPEYPAREAPNDAPMFESMGAARTSAAPGVE